eukprot:SAG31_NODE_47299_length_251_cov_0.565789_1_plen_63_part_10
MYNLSEIIFYSSLQMATIERSIEEMIEETEEDNVETEEVEVTPRSAPTPSIQRPKKKPRSQKQ